MTWWVLGLVACGGSTDETDEPLDVTDADADADADADSDADADADADSDTDADADTDTGSAPTGEASCALAADNPLRVECTATLDAEGTVELVLSAPGAPTRTFTSDVPALEHDLLGWGLKPDTTWDWTLAGQSGQVTTGPLDPELAAATVTVTGTAPTGFDAILQPTSCPSGNWFLMVDPDGDIVWYQPALAHGSRQDGYTWSQEDRSVLEIGGALFVEQHVSGTELLRLERDVDFEGLLHHDVTRWNGYTYLLYEIREGLANVDGFHVFDGPTRVGGWYLSDDYACPCDENGDWSHANGMNAADDGQIILSLLNFDTVISVDGDPSSPTFATTLWAASATEVPEIPSPDYLAGTGPEEDWDRQHNASLHPDGLWLFDNSSIENQSRGLRLTLDDVTGEARIEEEWRLDQTCLIQGGALPLEGGGALLTCATQEQVYGFAAGASEPSWELQVECGGGTLTMTHALPVRIE